MLEGVDGEELTPAPRRSVPTSGLNMVQQLCNLLDAMLVGEVEEKAAADPQVRA